VLAILWVGQIPSIEQVRHGINNIQQNGCGEKNPEVALKRHRAGTGENNQVDKIHAIPATTSNNLLAHPSLISFCVFRV